MKKNNLVGVIRNLLFVALFSLNFFITSCQTNYSKLIANDYKLFKPTIAWELAKAIRDNNVIIADKILTEQPNLINTVEPTYGSSLLILTLKNEQFEMFQYLIQKGIDVNIHNHFDGKSAIIECCMSKSYDIRFLKLLIEHGAKVNDLETGNRKDNNTTRNTPLIAASRNSSLEAVRLLVENNADINFKNEYGHSALTMSFLIDNYEVALFLLEKGADYNQPIFFRTEENKNVYILDMLREDFFELDSKEYKYKFKIINFLKLKGLDYKEIPVPNFIQKKAQKKYPTSWQDYLEKY